MQVPISYAIEHVSTQLAKLVTRQMSGAIKPQETRQFTEKLHGIHFMLFLVHFAYDIHTANNKYR